MVLVLSFSTFLSLWWPQFASSSTKHSPDFNDTIVYTQFNLQYVALKHHLIYFYYHCNTLCFKILKQFGKIACKHQSCHKQIYKHVIKGQFGQGNSNTGYQQYTNSFQDFLSMVNGKIAKKQIPRFKLFLVFINTSFTTWQKND